MENEHHVLLKLLSGNCTKEWCIRNVIASGAGVTVFT
jgi:hypothetical protein